MVTYDLDHHEAQLVLCALAGHDIADTRAVWMNMDIYLRRPQEVQWCWDCHTELDKAARDKWDAEGRALIPSAESLAPWTKGMWGGLRRRIPFNCKWCGSDEWADRRDKKFCGPSCRHYHWCSGPTGQACHHHEELIVQKMLENISREQSVRERAKIWAEYDEKRREAAELAPD